LASPISSSGTILNQKRIDLQQMKPIFKDTLDAC